jgi:indole-3-glycerol phosphate synthase
MFFNKNKKETPKRDILKEIIEKTEADVKERQAKMSEDMLGKSLAFNNYVPRNVAEILRRKDKDNDPYKIIAEIKKASPSKGLIREDFDPPAIAQSYENGGANALSILTEPHYFQGNLDYITWVRRYSKLPILRKDFITTKYQLIEALVYGADFVLLIAKALSRKQLKELYDYALHLGLSVLVEVHDKEDLIKATFAGAEIIGINSRNLETFEMDMTLFEKLIPLIPKNKVIVAESGINSHEQVSNLSKIGVDAFLIGEHFMRQKDITSAVKNIKNI